MPKIALTDALVKALRPRKTAYDVRDARLRGFGVRILPAGGKRFFIQSQHRGERIWKLIGNAANTNVAEAKSHAIETLAAIRKGETAPVRPEEMLFEVVAEAVFERYAHVWKPGTLNVNRCYLRNQLLSYFG